MSDDTVAYSVAKKPDFKAARELRKQKLETQRVINKKKLETQRLIKNKMGDAMHVVDEEPSGVVHEIGRNAEGDAVFLHGDMAGQSVNVRWHPKGDPRNRSLMQAIKASAPRYARRLSLQAREQKNFPYKSYGTAHLKRGSEATLARYGRGKWADVTAAQQAARNEDGWIGSGYYSNTGFGAQGRGAYWGKQLGGMLGGALGSRLGFGREGAAVGQWLGDKGSDMFERRIGLHGHGAYQGDAGGIMGDASGNMYHNSIAPQGAMMNQLINHSTPSRSIGTHIDETNSIEITHSEYIGDVTPTLATFQTQYFLAINPGLGGTFPWLSNIAQFYEEYEFKQLAFTMKSMVTEGNSNASGTVIMATQYNPANPAFVSKQVMENYDYANSSKVTLDSHHGVECDPSKHGGNAIEYVRVGAIPSNQDLKTYDMATFQLATNGASISPAITLGELWVSYKVVLRKTKIQQIGTISKINAFQASGSYSGAANSVSPSALFGTVQTALTFNSGSGSCYIQNNTLVLPAVVAGGNFVLSLVWTTVSTQGTGTISISTPTVGASVTNVNNIFNSFVTGETPTTDQECYLFSFTLSSTNPGPTTLSFSAPTALSAAGCIVNLYQVYSSQ